MSSVPELPADLADIVRVTLRDEVCAAEPSAAVWQGIRQRVAATGQRRGRALQVLRSAAVQTAAIAVVLIGLGVGASRYARPTCPPRGPLPPRGTSVSGWQVAGESREDLLSGRLIWLASREAPSARGVQQRGLVE
jgi:hypothetical protein